MCGIFQQAGVSDIDAKKAASKAKIILGTLRTDAEFSTLWQSCSLTNLANLRSGVLVQIMSQDIFSKGHSLGMAQHIANRSITGGLLSNSPSPSLLVLVTVVAYCICCN